MFQNEQKHTTWDHEIPGAWELKIKKSLESDSLLMSGGFWRFFVNFGREFRGCAPKIVPKILTYSSTLSANFYTPFENFFN